MATTDTGMSGLAFGAGPTTPAPTQAPVAWQPYNPASDNANPVAPNNNTAPGWEGWNPDAALAAMGSNPTAGNPTSLTGPVGSTWTPPPPPPPPAPAPVATAAPVPSGGLSFGGAPGTAPAPSPVAAPAPAPAPATGMSGVAPTPAPAPGTGTMGTAPNGVPVLSPLSPVPPKPSAQEISTFFEANKMTPTGRANIVQRANDFGLTMQEIMASTGYTPEETASFMSTYQISQGPDGKYMIGSAVPPMHGQQGASSTEWQAGQVINSPMNFETETIEGRIGSLLTTDQQGNYTNPVMQQAVNRQTQAFAARGLRNSSMAQQAGQEAAMSQAINIAAPDAERYYQNRRANVSEANSFARDELNHKREQDDAALANDRTLARDVLTNQQAMERDRLQAELKKDEAATDKVNEEETRDFNMRRDYQQAAQTVSTNFQRQMDTINASNMTPEDKSVAIAQAAATRDGEMTFTNKLYSAMPRWKNEWLASSVAAGSGTGIDIAGISNQDTLANIINDPAQPAATREEARVKLAALRAAAPAGSTPEDSTLAAGRAGMTGYTAAPQEQGF